MKHQNQKLRKSFPLLHPRKNKNTSVVGAALDYRIRTFFGHEENLIGMTGLFYIADFIGAPEESIAEYRDEFYRLRNLVQSKPPGTEHEDEYLEHCVLLSRAEVLIRAGRLLPEVVEFVYNTAKHGFKREFLTRVANGIDLQEIRSMAHSFAKTHWQSLSRLKPARLNPDFGSFSRAIGGADADMILGTRLYDIKTTQGLITGKYLSQIMAYSFLDDGVDTAGFYFARHCALVEWELEYLVGETSHLSPEQARQEFRDLVISIGNGDVSGS